MKLKIYLIKSIKFYQNNISILKKGSCLFYPTCSEYTKEAVDKYGIIIGIRLSIFRIVRCHPWQKNHFDPVP